MQTPKHPQLKDYYTPVALERATLSFFLEKCADGVCEPSVTSDFATPWTVARQDPLSMGIRQARILEWVAISSYRGASPTQGSNLCLLQVSCIAGGFSTAEPPGKPY